jgi:pilus assembly protein CpaB
LKKRTVLAVVCILLAIAIGFVLIPEYNEQQYKKTDAVIAMQDIPEGTQITADMVQSAEVFAQSIPSDTVSKADDVIGKYTGRFISKADYVTASKLSDVQLTKQGINVTGNKMIVSVTIPSAAEGLSGALKPGDLVSVYAVPNKQSTGTSTSILTAAIQPEPSVDAGESPSETASPTATPTTVPEIPDNAILPDELKYVEVAGIYSGNQSDGETGVDAIPATVSFYVDADQAKKLVEINSGATLHLVLVARGAARLNYIEKEDLQLWS